MTDNKDINNIGNVNGKSNDVELSIDDLKQVAGGRLCAVKSDNASCNPKLWAKHIIYGRDK